MKPETSYDTSRDSIPEKTGQYLTGNQDNNTGSELDTRGESGNLSDSDQFSPGPGEATSGRNKTIEGIRQGRTGHKKKHRSLFYKDQGPYSSTRCFPLNGRYLFEGHCPQFSI